MSHGSKTHSAPDIETLQMQEPIRLYQRQPTVGAWVSYVGSILVVVGLAVWFMFGRSIGRAGDKEIDDLPAGEKTLSLANKIETGVTDEGLKRLADKHPDLETLVINGSGMITDTGVKQIARISSLRELYLNRCSRITTDGLAPLTGLPRLEHLDLGGCGLSDSAIPVLSRFTQVKSMSLDFRDFSNAAIVQLRQALPYCAITTMNP